VLAAPGCARPPGPEATLRRFLELVDSGRTQEAWRLTAPAYREQCDLACFARVVERSRDELRRALGDLRAGAARVELRASLDLGAPHGTLPLVQRPEPGASPRGAPGPWLLAADPIDFYPQGTPEGALRSFVRAVEAGRWQVALRFVPQRVRQGM